ncbi:hypothetical protein ACVIW0_005833 [Bradyrhizobium sp. USDA 4454]
MLIGSSASQPAIPVWSHTARFCADGEINSAKLSATFGYKLHQGLRRSSAAKSFHQLRAFGGTDLLTGQIAP